MLYLILPQFPYFVSSRPPHMTQRTTTIEFVRFLIVGISNTAVDFFVFNFFIYIFGLAQGDSRYIYFKGISFMVAVLNSFVWNRKFVFRRTSNQADETSKEFMKFLAVSIVGLVINTTISYFVFYAGSKIFLNTHIQVLANAGAIVGSLVVFVSNFLGYKYLVFKK